MLRGTAACTPGHRLATFTSALATPSVSLLEIEVAACQWGLCQVPILMGPSGTTWWMPLDLLNLPLHSEADARPVFAQHGTCEQAQPASANTLFVE